MVRMIHKIAFALGLGIILITAISSAADFTLGIYGNANMDDTVDEQDIAYVEDVVRGSKPATNLTDANYDGKIDQQDIEQINRIIEGIDSSITFLDSSGNTVTVKKPIEKIILISAGEQGEALRILQSLDKVIGVGNSLKERKYAQNLFPEFRDLPNVGNWDNYEKILSLQPDTVMVYDWVNPSEMEKNLPGVTVLRFDFYKGRIMQEEMMRLGYILNKKEQAQKYIEFFQKNIKTIEERVKQIPDEDRPLVFQESGSEAYRTFNRAGGCSYQIEAAGGRSISSDLQGGPTGAFVVDPEYLITNNPEFIIKMAGWGYSEGGYGGNSSGMIELREGITNRTELAEVKALKDDNVYVIAYDVLYPPGMPISIAYFAKWFHPDLFADLDPVAIHQEYLDEFHNELNWNVKESGIFVYPPLAN